ncbi:flagellar biosynthesis protein [Melghiribacillus thermohalophilus]|uniref:Flagellar biosynthesis protein n=1 Tax=Melghiribacillus thermohalophilus TaxID=1324956 RepID=A0A4R3NH43_9BACI|nr:EscU/YscU/HrcU family type III secretion system export apparatus switch protein [Melghiribacillus thermohalophilus]TCT26788.1 flagellar biosynthesis protein [Melghiribacillus thermohalophilus]
MKRGKHVRKEAIALRYDEKKDSAPRVVAKGKGKVAETILEKAEKHGVPVKEDSALTELLGELDFNQTIPEDLYQAVAEVFAFIYNMDREFEKRKD